jgi:hypothetical protein
MIKFHYLGDTSVSHTNVIAIASELTDIEDEKFIKFGAAFSNKNDRYDKALGKHLAIQRFNENPYYVKVTELTFNSLIASMYNELLSDINSPSWLKELSK